MSGDRTGEAFTAELARLKRRGSALLVVSEGDGPGVCEDLLGSDDEWRRRVLVRADEFEELPVPGGDSIVVDATASDTRSTATFEPESLGEHLAGGRSIETVAMAVTNEVERLETAGLEAGELRVCLGTLDALVERSDLETVVTALRDVLVAVRSAEGMAHVHLSGGAEASVVDRFRPLVDVTVETHTTAGGIHQQRWRLHEAGIDTGWLQMQAR